MRYFGKIIRNAIIRFIDFFYCDPLQKLIPESLFRYIFCGAANMVFDWALYFIFYNFVFHKQLIITPFIAMSPHIAAFVFTFPISFTTGFLMGKYISFQNSSLRGKVQLMRYGIVTGSNILINYLGLKLLVENFHFFPTPSKMIVSILCVVFSYLMQRYFTFTQAKL